MMRTIKISIVTVCYNCEKTIKKTIESVLYQDYNNIEYIIIDGSSKDDTVQIIKSYERTFKKRGIEYKWVSEADTGIYDAMNKGIKIATGHWLNFMNAGDTFVNDKILTKVIGLNIIDLNLIYGDKEHKNKVVKPHPIEFLKSGIIMACHQAMFFNKETLKENLIYDLNFSIYADYELVNKIYLLSPNKICYIGFPVSIYLGGGISSFKSFEKRKDKFAILFKYYGLFGLFRGIKLAAIEKVTGRYNLKGEN